MSSNPEWMSENEQATAAVTPNVERVEGEIRGLRRDVSGFRRPRQESSGPAENINSVIERISRASVGEIDRVIGELTRVRDMLRSEGERVQREWPGLCIAEPGRHDVDEDHRRQHPAMEIAVISGRRSGPFLISRVKSAAARHRRRVDPTGSPLACSPLI